MGSESTFNSLVPPSSKDFGKKKRTNRSAKLKQYKLDARREQWLSQVKNKGGKEESTVGGGSSPSSLPLTNGRSRPMENLETKSRREENEGSDLHDSDLESLANSPVSSVLGGDDSRKDRPGSSSCSSRSSSTSGCCSGSVSDEEEDDGCLDDWEAVADALTADDKQHQPNLEPPAEPQIPIVSVDPPELPNNTSGTGVLKSECKRTVPRIAANGRAWRPDDAFRPQGLPNLSKQHSFPMNVERHCGHGAVTWACHSFTTPPSSCPICYEDLDLTDSSFLPCSCGFRLCLFCHKRILEADGRCPGCRKQYEIGETGVNGGASSPFRLSRSCSMKTRF